MVMMARRRRITFYAKVSKKPVHRRRVTFLAKPYKKDVIKIERANPKYYWDAKYTVRANKLVVGVFANKKDAVKHARAFKRKHKWNW